jgi:hypothetical protein
MATGVFPQVPRGGADDLGVFFLASQIASTIAAGLEIYQGVQGKSRTRVLGEHMADAAAEWSAPMGGPLPWIFTREARAALGPLSWNGRSLGELLEGIAPAGPVGSVFGTLTGVAAKTLLPLRKMPDRSVAPRAPDRRFLSLFGASVRDPETGEALDVAAARHAATAKESALNALSWAYKNAREYGAPPGMWFAQALDIRRDLVGYEDPVAGAGVDVGDHPQTQLGKAIRNAEPNQDARRALTRTTLQMLQDHYAQIVSVADNEEGLIWRTAVPPELFDRMMAGIWNKETNAEELVRLVHREATDARARKDSGGAYDSVLARIWKQEGLNELALKMKGEAVSQMRVDMQRFVEKTTSAFPEQNQATLTAKDYTDTFGAAAWDLFPSAMNQRPKFPSLFSTAK